MGDMPSSVKISGQNGAEGQCGTTSVAQPPSATMCLMTLGMRKIGGTSQLFSPAQETEKASTASVPGHQNLLLKRGNWVFS